jgi:hypothetical protein
VKSMYLLASMRINKYFVKVTLFVPLSFYCGCGYCWYGSYTFYSYYHDSSYEFMGRYIILLDFICDPFPYNHEWNWVKRNCRRIIEFMKC